MGITGKFIKEHKKIFIGIGIFLCSLLVIYFGAAAYFMNHFYYGSVVNAINVSGQTVEEVKEQMSSELQAYTLTLKERGGKKEKIGAADMGLKYNPEDQVEKIKDSQKPLEWIPAFFNTEDFNITIGVTYDEKLLKEAVDKLSCFNGSNIIEPRNAGFKYSNNAYEIVAEVPGNKVNKDILYEHVAKAILNKETAIDMEAVDCYVKPQYTSKSPEIIEMKNKLDKYAASKITYTFAEKKEVLDGSIINKWITVGENLAFTFDEEKVREYVDVLAQNYNTLYKPKKFVTSHKKTITVRGGDYGWSINKDKETEDLIAAIKEGQTITKQPKYSQTAQAYGFNDIGNTYVEIDLSGQHLWFYKKGSLVAQGDVVTGNVSAGYTTPAGVYRLKYKQRNAVLRGPGYEAPVDFWMPFNGGIGIHDATWRSRFGGTIYKTDGSHGCINCPYSLAKAIYNNIVPGTPVVCYY